MTVRNLGAGFVSMGREASAPPPPGTPAWILQDRGGTKCSPFAGSFPRPLLARLSSSRAPPLAYMSQVPLGEGGTSPPPRPGLPPLHVGPRGAWPQRAKGAQRVEGERARAMEEPGEGARQPQEQQLQRRGGGGGSSLALLTDLYQFTMAYGYWRAGRHREPAAFELFFRRCPFRGGFALSAGLGECLTFLRAFRFSQADLEYLASVLPGTTEKAFFDYLRTVDASEVSVSSAPEGSVVFSRVPLLQVKGPLLVVQLLETTLLCLVNYASLVATNAARFRLIAGPEKKLMEMGLRRAQGPDGGLSASKYSYVGGFDFTSNVLAGKLYGIPVRGTVAHSYILSFTSLAEVNPRRLQPQHGMDPVDFPSLVESWLSRVCQLLQVPVERVNCGELAAFVSYAITFPHNFQGLLDTFCVMKSGIPNFCAVALALNELGYRAIGVRLDSGDLAKQSAEIRRAFRTCSKHFQVPWFETVPIAVSNDVSEQYLEDLAQEGNEIDMIGIGTHLVTCPLQTSLGCVYKLVEVKGCPRLKVTEDKEKTTLPGSKQVYRLWDAAGFPCMDLMSLEEEPPPRAGREVEFWLVGTNGKSGKVTPTAVEILHRVYLKDGQVCQPLPSLVEIKDHAQASLNKLNPVHKRLRNPEVYQVAVTEKLHLLLLDLQRNSS
ncbi:nicotinate phosphoribosyltransferase [Rhineura floridana]|uniref:nicotinate phosphoribosyltransferase n=1 Tax=Rhineura floridana TaxID=261503 RepID=UPI002AC83289|nr:nicotinate phosphoribosyltransferase [Rhineura floridana]